MKALFTSLFFCFSISILMGQSLDRIQGDLLVKVHSESDIETVLRDFITFHGEETDLKLDEMVSAPAQIYLLSFDYSSIHEEVILRHIRMHKNVVEAQFNHLVKGRAVPNDPLFGQQWHLLNTGAGGLADADVDADEAWDMTTGGLTANGDTIVVAVLDDGYDPTHTDFAGNWWFNHGEIPSNGIDDDNNGYVDDYKGWNISTNNDLVDDMFSGFHGTPVSGMIGSKGNNGEGTAGMNWNIKIMMVQNNFNTNEAAVIAAYSYPLVMRQKYNATNGVEGAFVVATNASWGIDFGQAADAPLWCDFYNTLGQAGILNCGATSNQEYDVDVQGDLPTSCPSDHLIMVTATDNNDNRTFSAYGLTTVDLGAPGDNVFLPAWGNSYSNTSGTSFACPAVVGAIGLLYSAPCSSLPGLALSNPEQAVMDVKSYILDGTDIVGNLPGQTVTGGRLNLMNSLQLLMDNCGPCAAPSGITASNVSDMDATISWNNPDSAVSVNAEYNVAGTGVWISLGNIANPYVLTGLVPCTDYQIRIEAICPDTTSGFSQTFNFSTEGCCIVPGSSEVSDVLVNSATIAWEDIFAAASYNLRYRIVGSGIWDNVSPSTNSFALIGLVGCSQYEYQIQTICTSGVVTGWTGLYTFQTPGCGGCTDLIYCPSLGGSIVDEWIENVTLNTINNTSGPNGGYADFTSFSTVLEKNATYNLSLSQGYSSFAFDEYFKAWIDWNQDGDFDDADELIFDQGMTTNTFPNVLPFTVPNSALSGSARLRVSMNYFQEPFACDPTFLYGEVEEYCIEIEEDLPPPVVCEVPEAFDTVSVNQTYVDLQWDTVPGAVAYLLEYKKVVDQDWESVQMDENTWLIDELEVCEDYVSRVKVICESLVSNYSDLLYFTTTCAAPASLNNEAFESLYVFPNPFDQHLQIKGITASVNTLQLFSITGQSISVQWNEKAGIVEVLVDQELPSGVYFLNVQTEKGSTTFKINK